MHWYRWSYSDLAKSGNVTWSGGVTSAGAQKALAARPCPLLAIQLDPADGFDLPADRLVPILVAGHGLLVRGATRITRWGKVFGRGGERGAVR